MVTICPTITVETEEDYRMQIERIEPFAPNIHIDMSDGELAPVKLLGFDKIWWPANHSIDIHVMYRRPLEHAARMLALKPRLIILHAEAEGDLLSFGKELQAHGIKFGLALWQPTSIEILNLFMAELDHVLIFSGNPSRQGGSKVNPVMFDKVKAVRRLKPSIEIGWDGGVNDQNAKQLVEIGVDVLNVGGFIHNAPDPQAAYRLVRSKIA